MDFYEKIGVSCVVCKYKCRRYSQRTLFCVRCFLFAIKVGTVPLLWVSATAHYPAHCLCPMPLEFSCRNTFSCESTAWTDWLLFRMLICSTNSNKAGYFRAMSSENP